MLTRVNSMMGHEFHSLWLPVLRKSNKIQKGDSQKREQPIRANLIGEERGRPQSEETSRKEGNSPVHNNETVSLAPKCNRQSESQVIRDKLAPNKDRERII